MPAGHVQAGGSAKGIGMTDPEIWQIITYIRSQEVKAPAMAAGSARYGKDLFYGDANCSLCHMIEGKGGRLGPDLSGVGGSRTDDALVDWAAGQFSPLAVGRRRRRDTALLRALSPLFG
jgi:hypothetical protein